MNGATRNRSTRAGAVDVVVIGAGPAGLAMSRCLSERSLDHVVLERGAVANSWRNERWDSLRLLTPNWQNRLPGYRYAGADPDGFMSAAEVATFVEDYGKYVAAPVLTETNVTSVSAMEDGYCVESDRRSWRCRAVVIASGAHGVAVVPPSADALPRCVRALTSLEYRNPRQLDDSGVLVVGASASGLQLADEIQRSGRRVTLAVGEHIRMPRTHRGMDIQWWLDQLGILDERYDQVDDIVRARRVPSPQLIGTPERKTLDLNALTARGVEIVGRLVGIADGRAQFSGSLRNHCAMADLKLARLLERIETWASTNSSKLEGMPAIFAPTRVPDAPRLQLDFARERIGSVIWASGYRPDYSWLRVPTLDRKGNLLHSGGVGATPGLYALGLNFMRRRKSSFIYGIEDDARELSTHLTAYLRDRTRAGVLRAAV